MPFIFIFGVNPRETVLDEGLFLCPHCGVERQYVLKHSRSYVSLYFIPLIPLGKGREIVQCQFCQRSFTPDVLSSASKAKVKRQPVPLPTLMNTAESRLRGGEPVEDLLQEMTSAGLDLDIAREFLGQYVKPQYGYCANCSLTYQAYVANCADCGHELELKDANR
jgi:transcription elongation factor Elf1